MLRNLAVLFHEQWSLKLETSGQFGASVKQKKKKARLSRSNEKPKLNILINQSITDPTHNYSLWLLVLTSSQGGLLGFKIVRQFLLVVIIQKWLPVEFPRGRIMVLYWFLICVLSHKCQQALNSCL